MDLKQIEKLMAAMGRTQMKRLSLKQEGFEIELEKESFGAEPYVVVSRQEEAPPQTHTQPSQPAQSAPKAETGSFVTSPMVGTFYSSPSPDDPSFVKVGDELDEESVVCIIEAMKVMNEVKAQMKGRVVEALVKNGDPVEFGTKLFRVE